MKMCTATMIKVVCLFLPLVQCVHRSRVLLQLAANLHHYISKEA